MYPRDLLYASVCQELARTWCLSEGFIPLPEAPQGSPGHPTGLGHTSVGEETTSGDEGTVCPKRKRPAHLFVGGVPDGAAQHLSVLTPIL